jgi:hypothetical protein
MRLVDSELDVKLRSDYTINFFRIFGPVKFINSRNADLLVTVALHHAFVKFFGS